VEVQGARGDGRRDHPHPYAAPGPGAGAPPVVVLGTTGDPGTPCAWLVALSPDQLDADVLLTYRGDGHTIYRTGAPRCGRAPGRRLPDDRSGARARAC
jgi:hypothetical protein